MFCGTTLVATARIDLPGADTQDTAIDALLSILRARTADLVADHGPLALVIVGYEDERGDAGPAVFEAGRRADARGTPVMCAAVVHDGLWWDLRDPLCPDDGWVLPARADVPAAADFVGRGIAPLDSREQLVAMIEPMPCPPVAGLLPAASFLPDPGGSATAARADLRRVRLRQAGAWGRLLAPDRLAEPIDPAAAAADIADALSSLRDVPFRDALIAWLAPGALGRHEADRRIIAMLRAAGPVGWEPAAWGPAAGSAGWDRAAGSADGCAEFAPLRARLTLLARVAPSDQAAPILTVLAVVAWQAREGAMASIAVERALAYEPDYRLGMLLAQVLRCGVRPDYQTA